MGLVGHPWGRILSSPTSGLASGLIGCPTSFKVSTMRPPKYSGPNRRRNLIDRRRTIYDRRQNKWFGWYINWLFAKPLRFVALMTIAFVAIVWTIFLVLSDHLDMCDCDGDGIYFERRVEIRRNVSER